MSSVPRKVRSGGSLSRPEPGAWLAVLVIGLLWPLTAGAQELRDFDYENLEFRGIGIEVGTVHPTSIESTLSLGLRADLGFLGPSIRIVPSIRYWSSLMVEEEVARLERQIIDLVDLDLGPDDIELGPIRRSSFSLELDGQYVFTPEGVVEPYASLGAGLRFVNGRGEAIEDTFVEEALTVMAPSFQVAAGVNARIVDHLNLIGEARYAVSSAVREMTLLIGVQWMLESPLRPQIRPPR